MTANERSSMDWTFAVLASVVLHAGVLGLFVMTGRPPAAADETGGVDSALPPAAEQTGPATAAPGAESAPPGEVSPDPAPESPQPPETGVRPVPAQTPGGSAPAVSAAHDEDDVPEFYVVKQGDTVTRIARDFGTTPEKLAKLNGKSLRQMDNIWVGQKIRLRAAQKPL